MRAPTPIVDCLTPERIRSRYADLYLHGASRSRTVVLGQRSSLCKQRSGGSQMKYEGGVAH